MIRGLYTAATGMIAEQFVQDSLAGNLANINTTGYKQDQPTFRAVQDMAFNRYRTGSPGGSGVGAVGLGTAFDHTDTNFAAGTIVQTHDPLDLALTGDGFFAIQTSQGERYTRDGHFHAQPAGKGPDGKPIAYLATESGGLVSGMNGPINVGTASQISIDSQGTVTADGLAAGQLKIVTAPAAALQKSGANLYQISGPTTPSKASVRSGCLEQSNVTPIEGMVQMIAVQRAYEAAQHAITAQDDSLGKAVNDVGKV